MLGGEAWVSFNREDWKFDSPHPRLGILHFTAIHMTRIQRMVIANQ